MSELQKELMQLSETMITKGVSPDIISRFELGLKLQELLGLKRGYKR